MESIYIIDLTAKTVKKESYDILAEGDYGRGLALRLLREQVPLGTERFSPDNAMVLVPGLFAGCPAPSAGRMTILAKGGSTNVQICNTTGNLPQKLGALGVCALVIKGAYEEGNGVVHINAEGAKLLHMPELERKYTGETVTALKGSFGKDAAAIGTGIAGDMRLSLSTMFCTYPDGKPEYNCPRNGFGDILGSKGLRAVVVNGQSYFARSCADLTAFRAAGKRLAAEIIGNDICSGALPAYGSITLIKLLQSGGLLKEPQPAKNDTAAVKRDGRINLCCAPMCVIGCLNRHYSQSGERYDSPDQSELATALKNCFNLEDTAFLLELQQRLRNLCLVSPEFVTAARSYFAAMDVCPTKEGILSLVDEIENGSAIGRLVGSRTEGIAAAFPHRSDLQALTDKPAIADESSFQVKITQRGSLKFRDVDDMDMLYYQIFVLENLGICLFASFALVSNDAAITLLAEMFRKRTGLEHICGDDLISYAAKCSSNEKEYASENGAEAPNTNVPAFTKVLYRYFASRDESVREAKYL